MKKHYKRYIEYRIKIQLIASLATLVVLLGIYWYIPSFNLPAFFTTPIAISLQVLILTTLVWVVWAGLRLLQLLSYILYIARNLQEGVFTHLQDAHAYSDSEISICLQAVVQDMRQADEFAKAVSSGKLSEEAVQFNHTSNLGRSLADMQARLVTLAEEERQRNWLVSGHAKFGQLLQNHQNSDLNTLSAAFMEALAHYIEAQQGAVFMIVEEDAGKALIFTAGFACPRDTPKRLAWEEGLIGASVIERETFCLDNVPDDYLQISSALGASKPANILIVPLQHNDQVYGAVELASIRHFPEYRIQFIENICGRFAAAVEYASFNTTTQKLLKESQLSAQELQLKEETLRQNEEELLSTQEELNRKLAQIERESALTASILDAINKTNASLELDMDGNIIDVNDMYLSLMEYSRAELLGKPEKDFVSPDDLKSQRYDMMWESVRMGAHNSGEFKRINKSGRELWITGTYSPIYDVTGKPYKIVQFSQFTTEQKERELELSSKLEALNQCVALVELNLEGTMITANPIFLQIFGFKRIELRNKHFAHLLSPELADSEDYKQLWHKVIEGGTGQKLLQMHTKSGEIKYFIASFSSSRNLQGHIHRVFTVLLDVSNQQVLRQQVDNLLMEEKRKDAILEMQAETTDQFIGEISEILIRLEDRQSRVDLTPVLQRKNLPIIEFMPNGTIEFVNQAASKLVGTEEISLLGTSLFDILFFASEEELGHFKERINQPQLLQVKVRFKTILNSNVRFNAYLAPHFLEENSSFYMVMMVISVEDTLINLID